MQHNTNNTSIIDHSALDAIRRCVIVPKGMTSLFDVHSFVLKTLFVVALSFFFIQSLGMNNEIWHREDASRRSATQLVDMYSAETKKSMEEWSGHATNQLSHSSSSQKHANALLQERRRILLDYAMAAVRYASFDELAAPMVGGGDKTKQPDPISLTAQFVNVFYYASGGNPLLNIILHSTRRTEFLECCESCSSNQFVHRMDGTKVCMGCNVVGARFDEGNTVRVHHQDRVVLARAAANPRDLGSLSIHSSSSSSSSSSPPEPMESVSSTNESSSLVVPPSLPPTPTTRLNAEINQRANSSYFMDVMMIYEANGIITPMLRSVIDALRSHLTGIGVNPHTVTMGIIHTQLGILKKAECYDRIPLIHKDLTGVVPVQIGHLKNEALELQYYIAEGLAHIKKLGKIPAINMNYQLYKIMQLLDFNVTRANFHFTQTPHKTQEYVQAWGRLIDHLKTTYPSHTLSTSKPRWRLIFDS